jgi:hypothetical protein
LQEDKKMFEEKKENPISITAQLQMELANTGPNTARRKITLIKSNNILSDAEANAASMLHFRLGEFKTGMELLAKYSNTESEQNHRIIHSLFVAASYQELINFVATLGEKYSLSFAEYVYLVKSHIKLHNYDSAQKILDSRIENQNDQQFRHFKTLTQQIINKNTKQKRSPLTTSSITMFRATNSQSIISSAINSTLSEERRKKIYKDLTLLKKKMASRTADNISTSSTSLTPTNIASTLSSIATTIGDDEKTIPTPTLTPTSHCSSDSRS